MSIKIPVSAEFDSADVEQQLQQFRQQLNALGQQIAQANRVQFSPVSKTTVDDIRRVRSEFEALKRVSGDLNKRITATGQKGAGFFDLDWSKMYPDQHSRSRQMAKAFQYVTGIAMPEPAVRPGRPDPGQAPPAPRNPVVNAGAGALQAGLRGLSGVTGGAGGVAANALGTGMSAGFGAGLMGLMGGMLALGVSKIVGAATEKIDQAERNAIAYDTLKRTLGDVNVSFGALKANVEGAADRVKITFDESARLATQFAKLGNVTAEQYKGIGAEVETGVGLSRAYGLDPSAGVGALGTMRGLRLTSDVQDSKRFALLIGETITKAGAFAKADEVIGAIGNYATMQARYSMGANVSGYAGALAGMTGSGIRGLDVAGSANILGAVNSSLMAGGAHGEASQFFTGTIGARLGLDPFQTRVLREGGAFGTLNDAFGGDSAAAAFGMSGPGGNQTMLELTLSELRRKYGGNKGMLADATANHLGIGMRQAMALLASSEQFGSGGMGQMASSLQAYGIDLKDVNAGGIASLSKVLLGTDADRRGVAQGLRGRTGAGALSGAEARELDRVMAGGSAAEQKELLARLVATRDQEQTQGKDIRDSKNAVENIKTLMAEQLLPVTQSMRDGIMWMAGGKEGKSAQTIREQMAEVEVKDKYGRLIDEQKARKEKAMSPEFYSGLTGQAYADRMAESRRIQVEASQEISRLRKEQDAAVKAEVEKLREGERRQEDEQRRLQLLQKSSAPAGPIPGVSSAAALSSVSTATNPALARTRGFRNNNPGNLVDTIQWQGMVGSDGRFAQFATPELGYRAMGKNLLAYQSKHGLNTLRGIITRWAPPNENNTEAYIAKVAKEMGVDPDAPLNLRDQQTLTRLMTGITRHENGGLLHDQGVIGSGAAAAIGHKTPLPDNPQASSDQRFIFDAAPIEIIHKNERGEQVMPTQQLATSVRPAAPFGLG